MAPNLQAWMDVLARMEGEADNAGRVLGLVRQRDESRNAGDGPVPEPGPAKAWTPPQGLGPLPSELVERARNVEAAQQTAVERLEEAKRTTARHLAAVQSVPERRVSGRAVFLDVTS